MLRNGCNFVIHHSCHYQMQPSRQISVSCLHFSKNAFNLNRQGKVMGKLFGERVTGSKKRYYPTTEALKSKNGGSLLFKASQLGKPGGAGKNTLRRSAVLNKLFMEEISSLLATASIAEHFLGRGLQLTRVKIAPDFARVNVYWMGCGDPQMDGKLSDDLQHYSGLLRHELSQLRVMGEVPRIHFLQDKTFANIEQVDALLRNMDLREESSESEEGKIDFQRDAAERVKQEFYGNRMDLVDVTNLEQQEDSLPPMRHDVFGLDHRDIMSKILGKMKKTKQAWELHNEKQDATMCPHTDSGSIPSTLKNIQLQLEENSINSADEGFKKFLAQRQNRKNTPERKKYRKEDHLALVNVAKDSDAEIMLPTENDFYNQEDYLHEENEKNQKF